MKHKILLLGLGFWGSRWLDLIMHTGPAELAGICGTQEELTRLSEKYNIPQSLGYTDYKEAIKKSDAQIAVVVLPGALHFDADRLALQSGMHIITEKPLAMSMDEALELVQIKKNYPGRQFMVCQNYRWRPYNQTIRKAIASGMIGDIEQILVEFRRQEDLQGYRAGLEQPLLQDVSIHHFDLLRFYTGADFKSITCNSWRPSWSLFNGRPNTDAMIEMDNGIRVVYNGSWAARGAESSWDGNYTITGSKGCLKLDADNRVTLYKHTKDDAVVIDVCAQQGELLNHAKMPCTEAEYGLSVFMDCIENGSVPETTLEDNIHSFEMVCAGLESVQTGRKVHTKL